MSQLDHLTHQDLDKLLPNRRVNGLSETSHFKHLLSISFSQHFVLGAGITTMSHIVCSSGAQDQVGGTLELL